MSGSSTGIYLKIIFLLFILLNACQKPSEPLEMHTGDKGEWFQIEEGRLEKVLQIHPVAFKPWTVQGRVADINAYKDKIFLAVSGYGIAGFHSPNINDCEYFYDPLIFQYRTISRLLYDSKSLLCHLYFNKMLNITTEDQLTLQGISLLRLFPNDGIYQFIIPPFQKEHPDWESVGFIPENIDRFFFEWKYSDSKETRFHYSLFLLDGLSETDTDRYKYRNAYGFQKINSNLPEELAVLIKSAMKGLDSKHYTTAYHVLLRTAGDPLIRRYEHHPEGFIQAENIRLITLKAFQDNSTTYLLLPKGPILIRSRSGEISGIISLPELPDKFYYTDLFVEAGTFYIPWEQTSFTKVGSAGVYVLKKVQ